MHPGEILREEFMKPLKMNANQLARLLEVPSSRIRDIIAKKRGISVDTALRLAHYFGTTTHFWMNLQFEYDLKSVSPATLRSILKLPIREGAPANKSK